MNIAALVVVMQTVTPTSPSLPPVFPPINWTLTVDTGLYDAQQFGSVGLHSQFSLFGVGGQVGFGYDRVRTDAGQDGQGGYFDLMAQFRPLGWTPMFLYIDPYIEVGGRLGRVSFDDHSEFRGAFQAGIGVDFGFAPVPIIIGIGYRGAMLQQPDMSHHMLVVRIGTRLLLF